jgi:Protein of unknown function (DUF3631)
VTGALTLDDVARGLARRLRGYEVQPGPHRLGDDVKRGYLREDFHDAWLRYLPLDVTDVMAVTDLPGTGERGPSVTAYEAEVGDGFSTISVERSLSTNGEAQQALQPQHSPSEAE